MAEAARRLDVIDTAPPFAVEDAVRLNNLYRGTSTQEMLADLLAHQIGRAHV